ncbi:chlorophyll A-B binding protein [Aureococcus anophagefferens]|nr:chlorophyll A-B binding protein [Aureococcus anophagefferens]
MARLAFALAATCASTSALVAPTAAKASTSLNVATTSYDPSDFSDVTKLPGILAPVEFFDPLNFAADASESELKRYREAELTHGRVAMLASVGFLVGESGATPLFGGNIDGIAINQFWKVPTGFWPVILLFIAVPETFRALRGWMEPTVPENYFQLRSGYTPGDIDFDPLGLCPADAMEFRDADRRVPARRLAMLAAAA